MKRYIGLFVVLLLGIFICRPLLANGYFPMHDDTQVARVVEMGRALREGQFPVRWVSDLGYGYGYPIFNFYGPLPYYVGGFFYAIGLTGLTATKLMMGIGLVFAGVTMYGAVADILGVAAGILASTFYMYAPYHAVDVYVRGAVGEYWGLVFLPMIFWGFWRLYKKKYISGICLGSIGIAGLVVSHTILGYAGMIFVILGALALGKPTKQLTLTLFLGLGLSAFFWLPALVEMKYTNVSSVIGGGADFRNHFVCLGELWNSPWGFGGSAPGCLDGFSFKIGKEHLIFALIALAGLWIFVKSKKGKILTAIGLSILAVSVFFMLPISEPVWKIIPLFAYIQYPWRFLTFAIFGVSLMIGSLPLIIPWKYVRWAVVIICISVTVFVEAKRFVPQYIYPVASAALETPTDIEYRVSKISDEYLPPAVPRPANADGIVHATIPKSDLYTVLIEQNSDTYKKFEFRGTDANVKVNVAYFPGWTYMVNADIVKPKLDHGLPVLFVPGGLTVVQMWFNDTPVRKIANIISLLSVVTLFILYDQRKKTIS